MRYYHYTDSRNIASIMENCLKPGDNRNGTAFDLALSDCEPAIFLTTSYIGENDKYGGYCLEINIPKNIKIYPTLCPTTFFIKQKISPENITDLYQEYIDGVCEPSIFCEECPLKKECSYFN